ncbi:MAG: hypothetical protein K9K62_00910 [Desulfobacteraceae bacterium]|nr:hypothetical protein [Desulfobacteraceae bacterium]
MPAKPRESAAGQLPLTRGQQIRSHIKHTLENWFFQTAFPGLLIRKKYAAFQRLRQGDRSALELISRLEEIKQKRLVCDCEHIKHLCGLLDLEIQGLVDSLIAFNPIEYALLRNYHRKYAFYVNLALTEDPPGTAPPHVLSLASELSEDLAGGKAATLSVLGTEHSLPIPHGMAVTTRAFGLLLEKNRLLPAIQKELARLGPDNHEVIPEVSRTIRDWIMQAEMPKALETEVSEALKQHGMADTALALRSSAVGEDLQASFAGQFESRLNVPPENWVDAYKEVLASKYSPHALYYRMSQGFTDLMTPMAVLIMPTIEAEVSGILYTRDQNRPEQAALYMVSGSGEKLADGETCQATAGFDTRHDRLYDPGPSCPLPRQTLAELFRFGQTLEDIFGAPQDVEWLVDKHHRIHIVQSRPLRMSAEPPESEETDYPDAEILARGQWVSSGQASGRVHHLQDPSLPAQIPADAVLVTGELPPELTLALSRVRAVIAEKGSPACHFASVAREAGIPVICNAPDAGKLEDGQAVSLDGDQGVVLSGRRFASKPPEDGAQKPKDTPALRMLSAALAYISPLNLQDPGGADFSIQACKSLHDIVRYVHEAGVREMFSLVGRRGLDSYGAKRLISGIPLVMHVLDVHKGLAPDAGTMKTVRLEQVQSQPMQQLFAGLGSSAVQWDQDILHYDWDAYAKSSANFVNVEKSTLFSSYAIVDRQYLHALLRFGYHFAVLDALVSPQTEQNYIHFSFKGGGGNPEQRFFRIELIRTVLAHFRFSVSTTADMLEASFDRRSPADTGTNLGRLGIVLGKTVLLDMRLKEQKQVEPLAESIIQEVSDVFPVQE